VPELYHLRDDPGELHNQAELDEQRVETMVKALDAWDKSHPRGVLQNEHLNEDDLEALKNLGYL
jgi:hypothetical protein